MPGDVLLGYASTGLHTNGYTLARRIVFDRMKLGVGDSLGETGQHRRRRAARGAPELRGERAPVLGRMHALAHITGGGIPGNLVRVLPDGCEAIVDPASWQLPPLFARCSTRGQVSTDEMREVFNLGVGLIAVLPADGVAAAQAAARAAGVATWPMGEIRRGSPAVRFDRP